jgi:CRP-like cAMP-binding protein
MRAEGRLLARPPRGRIHPDLFSREDSLGSKAASTSVTRKRQREDGTEREMIGKPTRLSSMPLYAGLEDDELVDVAMGSRVLKFDQGDIIVRQGAEANGVYFILRGNAEVTIALPGGGKQWIADLTEGNMFGELAMIRGAPRNATVSAKSPTEVAFADWRFLTAALAQLRPGAFKVFRNLSKALAVRMRALNGKIEGAALTEDRPYELLKVSAEQSIGKENLADFEVEAFLPVLPCFRKFEMRSIEAVRSRTRIVESARGMELIKLNDPPDRSYIVVRGAVAAGVAGFGGIHLVSVRGPGSLCNATSMIDLLPASSSFLICEDAVLLELDAKQFQQLVTGTDETSYRFLDAVIEHQATALSRAVNHFKRIAGLTRAINQFRTASEVELSFNTG